MNQKKKMRVPSFLKQKYGDQISSYIDIKWYCAITNNSKSSYRKKNKKHIFKIFSYSRSDPVNSIEEHSKLRYVPLFLFCYTYVYFCAMSKLSTFLYYRVGSYCMHNLHILQCIVLVNAADLIGLALVNKHIQNELIYKNIIY